MRKLHFGADLKLLRSFESFVAESQVSAWLKTLDGRFLVTSDSLAVKLGISREDFRKVTDVDLLPEADAGRFRHGDFRATKSRQPVVVIEPPDAVDPQRWYATTKIAVGRPRARAVLGLSFSLDQLCELEKLRSEGGQDRAGGALWLSTARRYLDRSFLERVRVPEVAAHAGRSPDHLAACFRRSYGVTIARYLTARRVAWAARRLVTSDERLVDIALEAGFADQCHLTRAFRGVLGTTPARYRRGAGGVRAHADSALRVVTRAVDLARSVT